MPHTWRALQIDFLLLLLFWVPSHAAAHESRSREAPASKAEQAETPVLFTGLPAVVELPKGTLFSKNDGGTKCNALSLIPYAGTLREVRVTASGLGSVDFSVSNQSFHNQITIPELKPEGTTVNFCVHGDLLRQPASSAQGKLVAFAAGYKPVAAEVKMERPSLAPWITALQWFFAILLPAGIAAIFAVCSAWATSSLAQRSEQKNAFRKMKDEKWDELTEFFQTHLRNVLSQCQKDQEFAERLRLELQNRGYWTSIPWSERDRMEQYILRKEVSRMRSILSALFWEWKTDLSGLHK